MKLAIVGSRGFRDLAAVSEYIRQLPADTVIYTGGARGVDRFAEHCARVQGLVVVIRLAEWHRYGNSAGIIRTDAMLREVERVIAFWDGTSPGTRHAIAFAQSLQLPVTVVQDQRP